MNMDPAPPVIRLYTLNVQGLTPGKLFTILRWLREQAAHGAILTETRLTSDPQSMVTAEAGGGVIWPGVQIFHTPGTGHTGGIAVILGPGLHLSDPIQFSDPGHQHRILRVDVQFFNQPTCIIGIYGPAQRDERVAFWETTLPPFLPTDSRALLLAGDFNTVLSDKDCWYAQHHHSPVGANTRLIGSAQLNNIMQSHGLIDVWRDHHPNSVARTHICAGGLSGARLDRFLVSPAFSNTFRKATSTIESSAPITTDHRPVLLTFHAPSGLLPRGRGILGFPLAMLNIPDAVEDFRSIVTSECAAVLATPSVSRWRAAKARFLFTAHEIHDKYRRQRHLQAQAAAALAAAADQVLMDNSDPAQHAHLFASVQEAQSKVIEAWGVLFGPASKAARFLDHLFSESCTYYFHSQARPILKPTIIRHLNRPGPRANGDSPGTADLSTKAGVNCALKYAQDYFSSSSPIGLFRTRPPDVATQQRLLNHLPPPLPATMARYAEGPDGDGLLTREELEFALREAKRGSAPGLDGLPYEFYRAFSTLLTPVLLKVFNAAYESAQLSVRNSAGSARNSAADADDSQAEDDSNLDPLAELLQGVICLLHKAGKPAKEIGPGYRPITLLNCDVKLVLLIMSTRLQLPLDYLIDIMQSAYIRGRDISDNVRYHLGLKARLEELGIPAWLLLSDFFKAYDSSQRRLLFRSQRKMGLSSTGIILWNRILLNGSTARVRINGFFTDAFNVSDSLPQGSSLSCQDFIIVCQLAFSYLSNLQHAGRIASFPLPSGKSAPACAGYSDDLTAAILQPDQLSSVVRAAFTHMEHSGLPPQSVEKVSLQHISGACPPSMDPTAQPQHQPSGYHLLSAAEAAKQRHLGVPIASSATVSTAEAFDNMPGKLQAASQQWSHVQTTRIGLAHVANQCLLSKAVYQGLFRSPNVTQRDSIQVAANRFVAKAPRVDEASPNSLCLYPRAQVCQLDISCGGLGLLDVAAQFPSLIAKPCWRIFGYNIHPWVDLFAHEVSQAINIFDNGQRQDLTTDNALQPPPGLPPGHHWIITRPDAGRHHLDRIKTPSYRDSVTEFLSLNFQRIKPIATMDHYSIMLELTFDNVVSLPPTAAAPTALPSTQPATYSAAFKNVTTPKARTWLRLRDVRDAHRLRQDLQSPELQDLHYIIVSLPEPWRAAVCDPQDPVPTWHEISAPGAALAIFEGPNPMSQRVSLWLLTRQSGRLVPYTGDFDRVSSSASRPALVVSKPMHFSAWTRDDIDFVEAQQSLPKAERRELLQPWLIGFWDQMQLDPRVWGLLPGPCTDNATTALHDSVTARGGIGSGMGGGTHEPGMGGENDVMGNGALRGGPSDTGGVGRGGTGREGGNDSNDDEEDDTQHQTATTAPVISDIKGAISLLDMTVRAARLALSRHHAQIRGIPGIALAGAAWPPIWPTAGPATPLDSADIAAVPHHHLRPMGLIGLEERWRRSIPDDSPDAWTEAEIDRTPAWLRLRPPPSAGPSERTTRASRRDALRAATPSQTTAASAIQPSDTQPSADDDARHDFGGVWTRLCDPTLPRPARVTCWSILHGTLGCNAFIYHVRQGGQPHGHLPDSARWCSSPACSATGVHETLTHAFLDCPDVAPAIDWLLEAWQVLSAAPQRLPRSALLLLGDDPQAWPPDLVPVDRKTYRLWTRLRVHILGAIWRVRCSRAEVTVRHSSFARRVISTAVEQLIDNIQRDWARTQQDLRTMASGSFCQQWWRGRDTQISTSAFISQWATPELLCKVSGGSNGVPLALELLIGADMPVRFPD